MTSFVPNQGALTTRIHEERAEVPSRMLCALRQGNVPYVLERFPSKKKNIKIVKSQSLKSYFLVI